MRTDVEKIVGAAAVDERPVRDLWPAATMAERAGETPGRVLVARPGGREQGVSILRWATANAVIVTPLGGGSGGCGALAPQRAAPAPHLVPSHPHPQPDHGSPPP